MKYPKFWIYIIAAIVAAMIVACLCSCEPTRQTRTIENVSGTTAIACIKEKRHFLGFELNKDYFSIAQRRIALERSQPTLDFNNE